MFVKNSDQIQTTKTHLLNPRHTLAFHTQPELSCCAVQVQFRLITSILEMSVELLNFASIQIGGKHETNSKSAQHGLCLKAPMNPQVILKEHSQPRASESGLEVQTNSGSDAITQTQNSKKQISKIGQFLRSSLPFLALALPLFVLATKSPEKLLIKQPSDLILGLPVYTQGIWMLIYTAIFVFCLRQAQIAVRSDQHSSLVVLAIAMSCLFNAVWLLIDSPIWSLVIQVCWLISLAFAYRFLEFNSAKAVQKSWFSQAVIGLYLGWVTVNTVITVSEVLLSSRWNGLSLPAIFWASTVILSLAMLGLWRALRHNDAFFNLALVWAYAGYFFRSPLDPALMPALMVALASAIFTIVREPHEDSRYTRHNPQATTIDY